MNAQNATESMLGTSAVVDNALVNMKNILINRIHKAQDACDMGEILDTLYFVLPLWTALGYAYKCKELASRIVALCDMHIVHCDMSQDGLRTNSTSWRGWRDERIHLQAVRNRAQIIA